MSLQTSERRPTLRDLRKKIAQRTPFGMLTCYDATMAKYLSQGGVDFLLVGDTAAQMVLGYDTTLPVDMQAMLLLTAAVRRGAPQAMIMADMPFGSYQTSIPKAIENALAFVKQADADLVKLEVTAAHAPLVEALTQAGIAVVAHIGSRPQTVRQQGGFRAVGRSEAEAQAVFRDAEAMLQAGSSVLLVEAVPDHVAEHVVELAHANDPLTPVIGCGAGPHCDGHVVVTHDLLGLTNWQPPFALPRAQIGDQISTAAKQWLNDVEQGAYLKDGSPYNPKTN